MAQSEIMSPTLLRLSALLEETRIDAKPPENFDRLVRYFGVLSLTSKGSLSAQDACSILSRELDRQNSYLFRLSTAGWLVADREFPLLKLVDEIVAMNSLAQ